MKPELDLLSGDARALIGAARGGDEVSPAERRNVLAAFERRLGEEARGDTAHHAWRGDTPHPEAVFAARHRSGVRRRPATRFAWTLAALVCTGSLAAFAQHRGAFAGLGAALEHALGVRKEPPPQRRPAVLPGPVSPGPVSPQAVSPQAVSPGSVSPQAVSPQAVRAPELLPEPPSRFEPELPSPVFAEPPPIAPPDPVELDAPHPSRRAPPASDLNAQELQLISKARDEFRARRYSSAFHSASLHQQRFPRGALSEERDALIAMIDCHLRIGSRRAHGFLDSHPRSLFAEQVRRSCQLPSNAVPGEPAPGTQ